MNQPSELRVETVLDTAVDAIVSIDEAGRIGLFNKSAERMFGYSADEVRGRNVKILMPEPYASAHDGYIRNYLTTRKKKIIGIGREVVALRKDGSIFPAELAVGEDTGNPTHRFVGFIRDISEKKLMEQRSLRSQRLESIGTLAGGIAHDLNNVLTPILMSIRLLKKDRPQHERESLLDTAQASVERGTALIKQLLAFAGGAAAAKEPVEVCKIVEEVRSLLEHTLLKSVELKMMCPANLWRVSGDSTQLAQVLMNLCVNARDAMPSGGVLTIACDNVTANQPIPSFPHEIAPGRYVRLTVTDSGTGIPAEVMEKIFDPFFTTKEFGRGTGLGLSNVLGIVRGHGGAVNVYSEEGHGTRVSVYVPALVDTSELAGASPRDDTIPMGQGELLLLVDDETAILTTAKLVLEAAGYRVISARDGNEALKVYREHANDIKAILLDMMMPGMDGPSTLVELAKIAPSARVIAASGLRAASREFPPGALKPRASLQKPYSEDELLSTLSEVLRS